MRDKRTPKDVCGEAIYTAEHRKQRFQARTSTRSAKSTLMILVVSLARNSSSEAHQGEHQSPIQILGARENDLSSFSLAWSQHYPEQIYQQNCPQRSLSTLTLSPIAIIILPYHHRHHNHHQHPLIIIIIVINSGSCSTGRNIIISTIFIIIIASTSLPLSLSSSSSSSSSSS